MLPELETYTPTSDKTVNRIIERRYIKFWQELRQVDHKREMKYLVIQSKGTALPFDNFSSPNADSSSNKDASVQKPVPDKSSLPSLKQNVSNKESMVKQFEQFVGWKGGLMPSNSARLQYMLSGRGPFEALLLQPIFSLTMGL